MSSSNEIRSSFLQYFKKQGHEIIESSSLVPHNDPTLLFTNAGMNQFKDTFLGKEKRNYSRATTSQKCVRAGGKHNDLENVGFTARHHTFFEMLGNFSFGDYFKKDAIHFAWEFVTKELKLPKDKLYVSVFQEDDEAAEIWHKQEGIPRDRIYKLGEKDNFWSMGDTGPCGPCTEIFYDRGEKFGSVGHQGMDPENGERFMEFWNLVFMQYDRNEHGVLTPLPKPSVDTGAGLERMCAILQGVDSNFETDLFTPLIKQTAELCKSKDLKSASFKVIADHARAATFLISDGVLPSNEGRGYVLRRIIRRAIRHGKNVGFKEPFLYQVCGWVSDLMSGAYPDLKKQIDFVKKAVFSEEEQFLKTLEKGLELLEKETSTMKSGQALSGKVAFKLYDTFGFPLDLTKVILDEKKLGLNESEFDSEMKRQKEESRKNWKGSGESFLEEGYLKLENELEKKGLLPKFVGYEEHRSIAQVLALFKRTKNTLERVDQISAHEKDGVYEAVLSPTPFYGESGGQVGDQGQILDQNGLLIAQVEDVQKPTPRLVVCHLNNITHSLEVGQTVHALTEKAIRDQTARNHTATHLLHWALRKVLGTHVKQAGSLVTPDYLRFDFTHFQALTKNELNAIESMINEKIWKNDGVKKSLMNKEDAIAKGAIAMFGEKYDDVVRVIEVGDYSIELCGGTHVDQSSDIHLFLIQSESSVASGVRRIQALTSQGAFQYLKSRDEKLDHIASQLKASTDDEVVQKIEKTQESERNLKKKIEQLELKVSRFEFQDALKNSEKISPNLSFIEIEVPSHENGMKHLRDLSEFYKNKASDFVTLLTMKEEESQKIQILAVRGIQVDKKISMKTLIQTLSPLIEGKGGGKDDLAQAGGMYPNGAKKLKEESIRFLKSQI